MQVPKPKKLPTKKDYEDLRGKIKLALQQLAPDGNCCSICGDNDHQAWECHHNPISIEYQAQHFKCFHCGDIILGNDEKGGEEHFGEKGSTLPKCVCQEYNLLEHHLANLPMTWYPALIIHMVEIAHKKKVFKKFGATRMIRRLERDNTETKININNQMKAAIEGALRIKSCWLPGPEENIDPENIGEAQALMDMYKTFKSLVGDK